MTQDKIAQLLKSADGHRATISQLARKFEISRWYCRTILRKNNIKMYAVKNVPKASEQQRQRQVERMKILRRGALRNIRDCVIIFDDESYFSLENKYSQHFLSSDPKNVDSSVKFIGKTKFL